MIVFVIFLAAFFLFLLVLLASGSWRWWRRSFVVFVVLLSWSALIARDVAGVTFAATLGVGLGLFQPD